MKSLVKKTSICVVGAGAIGTLLAVPLALRGYDVTVLARNATFETLQQSGMRLEKGENKMHARPRVIRTGAELSYQDVVVLAVKANDVVNVAPHLQYLVGPETTVVSTMNGIPWWFFDDFPRCDVEVLSISECAREMRRYVKLRQVVGCLAFINCNRSSDGITHWNAGEQIVVGSASMEGAAHCERIFKLCLDCGFDVRYTKSIHCEIWDKLIGNAVLNPVSALTGRLISDIFNNEFTRQIVILAMSEIEQLGRWLGFKELLSSEQRLASLQRLGACKTSMLQDVLAGRITEAVPLIQPLVELGCRAGIGMPIMSTLFGLACFLKTDVHNGE